MNENENWEQEKVPERSALRDFLFTSDRDEEVAAAEAAAEVAAHPNDVRPSVAAVAEAEARTNASAAVEVAMAAVVASNDVCRGDAGQESAFWRSRVKPRSC